MRTKTVAWMLITGTAAVTAVGAFIPEAGLAVGSAILGTAALGTSLNARLQVARNSIGQKMLEQMR
jgi:hypothetical protein